MSLATRQGVLAANDRAPGEQKGAQGRNASPTPSSLVVPTTFGVFLPMNTEVHIDDDRMRAMLVGIV